MFEAVIDFALSFAQTPWIFLIIIGVAIVDGFFPPIPSESIVIAVASLIGVSSRFDLLVPLVLSATIGAFLGDSTAYLIGRKADISRFAIFRAKRGAATLAWATETLRRRGGPLILAARYVPVGRVAVNMTAGTLRYPYRRFAVFAALAALMWAIYGAVIGLAAGKAVEDNPLLGVAIGVVSGVLIGFGIERALSWRDRRRAKANGAEPQAEEPETRRRPDAELIAE